MEDRVGLNRWFWAVRRSFVAGSLALAAVTAAPPDAFALGLVSEYTVTRVDNPQPASGSQMGWLGIANAGDLNGDGSDDILVPNYAGPGRIHIFSGDNGQLIRTLELPDAATSTAGSAGNFVYPAKLTDLASCPGTGANQPCPAIGAGDGVPEVLVGASGVDIAGAAPDMGRAYVFDGATGALLKKVQMPAADLASEAAQFPTGKSFSFGRAVISPSSPFPANAPVAVKRGDFDGGGEADFIVGNPTFYEAGPTANPTCTPGPCPGSGRAYFYRGEDVTGSAATILDTPLRVVKNPAAETDLTATPNHERFGHAFIAVGDVGKCDTNPGPGATCPAGTTAPDGRPDAVITAHQATSGGLDAGVVWLVDGATGAILRRYDHPEPQDAALFGYYVGTMSTAIGDVFGSAMPDIYAPAVGQVGVEVGQGRGYILNGEWTSPNALLTTLNDPTPHRGENFGAPASGIGDAGGTARNDILVGVAGPWQPGDDRTYTGQVLVVEPATGNILLNLQDPDQRAGSGFGQGAVQLGDVNKDGAMDFAAEAGYWPNIGAATDRMGRLYIFQSVNPPAPPATRPTTPATGVYALPSTFPGCPSLTANVIRASAAGGPLTGTARADRIFGGAGNDIVNALAGDDCLDLRAGADRGRGGSGRDLMLGGRGKDRLSGGSGADRVRGGSSADRLDGGSGNDSLSGGSGNDRIKGSTGRDRISGGSGKDRIDTRDRRRGDRVACGSGRDSVVADRRDRVARDCERIRRR